MSNAQKGNRTERISKDKQDAVLYLLKKDLSCNAIARITGVSSTTVRRIRDEHVEELMSPEQKTKDYVKKWLLDNWHFVVPDKKQPKKTSKTHFRTPFNQNNIKSFNIYDIKEKQRRKQS